MRGGGASADRWGTLLLAAATVLTFSPALVAGYIGYDDDWLVEHNPLLAQPSPGVLAFVFTRFDLETRLALGGEFLPVRDVAVWIVRGVLDLPAQAMHAVQLGIYVLAMLAFRRALIHVFGPSLRTELASLLFAIHPVHAESVVWLAGMKDVLALAFSGAAFAAYAGATRRGGLVALFTLLACFSKGASVVLPALFLAADYALGRRPRWVTLGAASFIAASALAVHLAVGGQVGILAEPIGGSRAVAASSMLVVVFRYLGLAFFLNPHAVVYEVEALGAGDPRVVAAAIALIVVIAIAAWAHRRGSRAPAFAWMVFAIGLAPVSQVVAPLQNHMADRYLMLAVLGPMILLAFGVCALIERARAERLAPLVALALAASVGLLGFVRARAYSDPVALFYEATERTSKSGVAPYQLAMTLEEQGEEEAAEVFYREAYRREGSFTERGRRAGNNLARLLYRQGRVPEAVALLRELREAHPDHPRVLFNLSRALRAMGEVHEADSLLEELRRRFPTYEVERHIERHGPEY